MFKEMKPLLGGFPYEAWSLSQFIPKAKSQSFFPMYFQVSLEVKIKVHIHITSPQKYNQHSHLIYLIAARWRHKSCDSLKVVCKIKLSAAKNNKEHLQ